jgi:hypothetical protein
MLPEKIPLREYVKDLFTAVRRILAGFYASFADNGEKLGGLVFGEDNGAFII